MITPSCLPLIVILVEEDAGPRGVARVKCFDQGLNFYPSFPVENSLVLDFRADQIHQLSTDIQAQRQSIMLQHDGADPCELPFTNKNRKKFMKRMSLLAEAIDKYSTLCCDTGTLCVNLEGDNSWTDPILLLDVAWVNSKLIEEGREPDPNSVYELQTYLDRRSRGQLPQYESQNVLDFRLLKPRIGFIERAIKVVMPVKRVGRWVLVSLSGCPGEFFHLMHRYVLYTSY